MNLNKIHAYLQAIYLYKNYDHRHGIKTALELIANINTARSKLNTEEKIEAERLCKLRGLRE